MDKYHCYSDTAGTVLAAENGSVAYIKNARPNTYTANNNAIQTVTAKRAILKSDGLEFTRSADGGYPVDLSYLANETSVSILSVFARTVDTTNNGFSTIISGQTDATNSQYSLFFRTDGKLNYTQFNNSLVSPTAPAFVNRKFSINITENYGTAFPRTLTRDGSVLASTTSTTTAPNTNPLVSNTGGIIGNTNSILYRTGAAHANNLGTAFGGVISDIWIWVGSVAAYTNWDNNMLGRFFNYYRDLKIPAYTTG
jgi:hypothetical protein